MARYIDADELLKKKWDADTRCGYVQVVDVGTIEEQPTVDVVEVVRCKYCTYKMKNAFGLGIICDKIGAYMPTENSFCSYGKKVK